MMEMSLTKLENVLTIKHFASKQLTDLTITKSEVLVSRRATVLFKFTLKVVDFGLLLDSTEVFVLTS